MTSSAFTGRVLSGGCVELGDIGLPYLPVVDALRELADDPEEARLLAGAAPPATSSPSWPAPCAEPG